MSTPARPLLVLVSGRPGSGKSTLARVLSDLLWLPLLSCDALRTGISEARALGGHVAPPAGREVVDAFYRALDHFLSAGVGLVAEMSFRRGLDEPRLAPLLTRARVRNVHCQLAAEAARHRFLARQPQRDENLRRAYGEGHPMIARHLRGGIGHRVVDQMEQKTFDWTPFEPLDLDMPRLSVDTARAYAPHIDAILAFCRRQ